MVEEILAQLDKVKSTGTNKWTACCPVHGDRSPSMSIAEKDGKVLCHCFSCGAKGIDVVNSLGLSPKVLFRDSGDYDRVAVNRAKMLDEQWSDDVYVRMYEKAQSNGHEPKLSEWKRYKLAVNRLEGIKLAFAENNC